MYEQCDRLVRIHRDRTRTMYHNVFILNAKLRCMDGYLYESTSTLTMSVWLADLERLKLRKKLSLNVDSTNGGGATQQGQ